MTSIRFVPSLFLVLLLLALDTNDVGAQRSHAPPAALHPRAPVDSIQLAAWSVEVTVRRGTHLGVLDGDLEPPASRVVRAGLLGAAAGAAAGILIGRLVEREHCNGVTCTPLEPILLGVAGEVIGMVAGVHWGNERRGSLPLTSATSTIIAAGGLLLGAYMAPTMESAIPVIVTVGTFQLWATVMAERW